MVHTQGIELFTMNGIEYKYFVLKKNTPFKRLTDQLKWKLF